MTKCTKLSEDGDRKKAVAKGKGRKFAFQKKKVENVASTVDFKRAPWLTKYKLDSQVILSGEAPMRTRVIKFLSTKLKSLAFF